MIKIITIQILLIFLLPFSIFSQNKKYIKDLDNDYIDDKIIFKQNSSTGNYELIEINLSRHGNLNLKSETGVDLISSKGDILQYTDQWDERFYNMFYLLMKDKQNYLLIYHKPTDDSYGKKTVIKIDSLGYSILFDKPFEIAKILPDNKSINIFGRTLVPYNYNDTTINGRKYELFEYVHYLCYTITESSEIDIGKSISYNQNYFVGWAVSDKRRVIKDKGTGEEKFLFESYRKYPETSLRILNKSDLQIYSNEELRIMRNEIFADYGYVFSDEYLNWYFNQFEWYKEEDKIVEGDLSEIEIKNINLIKSMENN